MTLFHDSWEVRVGQSPMIYGIEGFVYHLHHTGNFLAKLDIQYRLKHCRDIIDQAQSDGAAMVGPQITN